VEQGTILVNLKGRSPVSSTPLTGPKQNDDDDDPSQEGKEPRNSEREEEEKSREVK
jgi:hypothetical protein